MRCVQPAERSYFTLPFAHTLQFQDMSVPTVGTQQKGDKIIDSGTSTASLTPHSYCTRFETNVNEKGIVHRCVECNKEYFTPWFDIMAPVVKEILKKLNIKY